MKNNRTIPAHRSSVLHQCMLFSVAMLLFYTVMAEQAHAIGGTLCAMIGSVMGSGLARAIATVGVLMVGVGATLGRMSWTLAITVAVGIAAMFSTASLVGSLSGGAMGCFGT